MKTKKILAALLSTAMVLGTLVMPASAASAWDGTTVDTSWYTANSSATSFTISTPAELAGLASIVNAGTDQFSGDTITLAADIDFASKAITPIGLNDNAKDFLGTFDGNGKVVRNYTINVNSLTTLNSCYGLFGRASYPAVIKNLGTENVTLNVTVTGDGWQGGALVGYLRNNVNAKVTNCYATNVVYAGTGKLGYCGGLVGNVRGTVENSYVRDVVYNAGLQETATYSSGIGNITNNQGAINNCYAGGYNESSYTRITGAGRNVNSAGTTSNVYYDTYQNVTSGSWSAQAIGTAVSTSDLKTLASTITLGSAFAVNTNPEYNDGYPVLSWETVPAATYDTSWYTANPDATSFTISDTLDFIGFAKLVTEGTTFAGKTVTLANDIDFGGAEINPVGTQDKAFQGTFDGNENTISNVKIVNAAPESNTEIGLFARVKAATIKNVGIENIEISYGYTGTSGARFAGGLVGHAREGATIDNCYVRTVTLSDLTTSGDIAGALIGQIRDNVTVKNSYAVNRVIGENVNTEALVSGLIGIVNASGSASTIENCYAGKYNYNESYSKIVGAVRDNHASTTITNLYYDTFQWVDKADWAEQAKGTATAGIKTLDGIEIGTAFVKNINADYNFGYPTLTWEEVPLVDATAEVTNVHSVKVSDDDMATGVAISVTPNNYTVNGIAWEITNESNAKADFNTAFGTALSGEGNVSAALYIDGLYIEDFALSNVAVSAITDTVVNSLVTME